MNEEKYFEIANANLKNSYAPYSNFHVSAVLVTANDKVYTGVNIENVSFGNTMCAERVALFEAVKLGERDLKEIYITCDSDTTFPWPCGSCLQALSEFNDGSMTVFISNKTGKIIEHKLSSLLPKAFNGDF